MTSEPSGTNHPVRLAVTIADPSNQMREAEVPLDATVADLVDCVCRGLSRDPDGHRLQVPLRYSNGNIEWHFVADDERLLDALTGVERPVRIVTDRDLPKL